MKEPVKQMPTFFFRRVLAFLLLSLTFFITGCGPVAGGVTYKPPFGMVSLRIGTDGISVQASSPDLETLLGTFAVDLSTSLSAAKDQQPRDDGLLLTIRYSKQRALVDEVYQIHTGGSKVVVSANGHIPFSVENQRVFIDASKGSIQAIEVSDASRFVGDTPVTDISTPTTSFPFLTPDTSLHSIDGSTSIHIIFRNTTKQTLSVYWVNYQGQDVLYSTLGPRQSYTQQTYVTHPWRVKESEGHLVKEIIAQYDWQTITI